jgi:hypothetical protein
MYPACIGEGVVVLTFTLDPRCWWLVRAFCRNPLIRGSDRVEALIVGFVIVVSLVVVPVAGAVGTAVYDARHQLYAHEAQTRHPAAATVIGDSATHPPDSGNAVPARRTAALAGKAAKADEASKVWVDNDGNQVDPPTPTSHAAADGIRAAAAILLSVVVAATLVAVAHSRLSRMRDAQWERDLRCGLANEDDGRNNRSYG